MTAKNRTPTGERISISIEEDFPVFVIETIGISEESTVPHWHDCMEICYLKQGTGTYLIGGRNYPFEEGDVFAINSKDVHLAYNDKDVIMLVILFKPELLWNASCYPFEVGYMKPFWEFGSKVGNKLDKNNKYYKTLIEIMFEIENEFMNGKNGYRLVIKSLILKLSAYLSRYLDIEEDEGLSGRLKNSVRLEPIFKFIEANYTRKITMKEMASLVNMSVSNFSFVFKNTFGISPLEYVIRARIVKASELLITTDTKIIDIAADCGFFSLSNFNECFKKYTGRTPRDFKKSYPAK